MIITGSAAAASTSQAATLFRPFTQIVSLQLHLQLCSHSHSWAGGKHFLAHSCCLALSKIYIWGSVFLFTKSKPLVTVILLVSFTSFVCGVTAAVQSGLIGVCATRLYLSWRCRLPLLMFSLVLSVTKLSKVQVATIMWLACQTSADIIITGVFLNPSFQLPSVLKLIPNDCARLSLSDAQPPYAGLFGTHEQAFGRPIQ